MPKIKTIPHLHRYKRVDLARNPGKEYLVYRCTKPLCSHYVSVDLALGKLSECNRCGEPMIMDKVAVTLALPHCLSCTKRKDTNEATVDAIAEFLKEHSDGG